MDISTWGMGWIILFQLVMGLAFAVISGLTSRYKFDNYSSPFASSVMATVRFVSIFQLLLLWFLNQNELIMTIFVTSAVVTTPIAVIATLFVAGKLITGLMSRASTSLPMRIIWGFLYIMWMTSFVKDAMPCFMSMFRHMQTFSIPVVLLGLGGTVLMFFTAALPVFAIYLKLAHLEERIPNLSVG